MGKRRGGYQNPLHEPLQALTGTHCLSRRGLGAGAQGKMLDVLTTLILIPKLSPSAPRPPAYLCDLGGALAPLAFGFLLWVRGTSWGWDGAFDCIRKL